MLHDHRGSKNPNWRGGIYSDRREYWKANSKRRYAEHPEIIKAQVRKSHFKVRYGISLGVLEFIASLQGYRCAICKKVKKLVVDHNHQTGEFRGLVCHRCNTFIGFVEKGGLEGVLEWLRKW